MSEVIKIKKGLDIPIGGKASSTVIADTLTEVFAITPDDFGGYTWKACVKEGEDVEIGTPLLYSKEDDTLNLVSPISGKVKEICRGERRKIEYISIERADTQKQIEFNFDESDEVQKKLKKSGLFAFIRQRPFDIVASTKDTPRDIFVTAFDSAPLALENISYDPTYLEAGLKALKALTSGKVYLSVRKGSKLTSSSAEIYEFEGPHPAGNVGTQIAAIKPVNKGETVWTTDISTVSRIGEFMESGKLNFKTNVALTGDELKDPHIVETTIGASVHTLLEGQLKQSQEKIRVISGNVLTGIKVNENTGFLRFPYRQLTVIAEGDNADEFMGWASINPGKYSVKRSFPSFLRGSRNPFKFDARIKGGHRAMIMSGEYDKVFPMDIYPEFLIKAIIAKDIEKMEKLGIYEIAPEDFALPEFVDTSKIELQKIVREGLDYLRKETT